MKTMYFPAFSRRHFFFFAVLTLCLITVVSAYEKPTMRSFERGAPPNGHESTKVAGAYFNFGSAQSVEFSGSKNEPSRSHYRPEFDDSFFSLFGREPENDAFRRIASEIFGAEPWIAVSSFFAEDNRFRFATRALSEVSPAVDQNVPTVRFSNFRNYTRISNQVVIEVQAADDAAVDRVDLYIDKMLFQSQSVAAGQSNATVRFFWNTALNANGKHLLRAQVFDASGNSATAALTVITHNYAVTPDTIAPSVVITSPANNTNAAGVINITSTAADNVGVVGVQFKLDGVNLGAEIMSAPFNFAWDTRAVTNGGYLITAVARDAAGNSKISTGIVVNVSNAAGTATPTPTPTPTVTPTPTPTPAPAGNNIVLNPSVKYQTMGGWETTAESGELYSPAWSNYKAALLEQAVSDLGLNRIRLEIKSGVENPVDYFARWRSGQITEEQYSARQYEIINDNSSPNSINPNGFQWSSLDNTIEQIVVPMKQKLEARGERLWINVNYVDFDALPFEHYNDPEEYAEFVLAAYQHMQSRFGFVPNSWEVMLEPDNGTGWDATKVAQVIKAAGDRLIANNFTPNLVAPSTTNAANAPVYIDKIAQTPGAMQYVGEFSYHRYCCASDEVLSRIADRAVLYNKQSSMLEWIGADYNTLHDDIKKGRVSSWQQYVLAFPNQPDNGAQYYLINDSNVNNPTVILTSRAKFLRQYFKYVRFGAQRIAADAGNTNFDPLAFINTDGKYVVVVKASSGGSFNVTGLAAGTYGIKYTTSTQYDFNLPDVSVSNGQSVTSSIPAGGVITIYAK